MVCEFPKLWAPASLYNFCTILKQTITFPYYATLTQGWN